MAGSSAFDQSLRSEPAAQVEWVPLEIRSGSFKVQTGPAEMSAASNTRQNEASAFMSVVNVMR
ncbi:hypothetical protein [Aeromicrobium sp. UC242_57]|uniref:hypothetical protein n=1 Tax=Aeromicrobium sp. UC242_57 TaxID=3374624 RepID=UPI0037A525B9